MTTNAISNEGDTAVNTVEIRPLMGNEAIARGAWEAGVRVAAAYPGTPSTEIMESLATYPAEDVTAQWAANEKVSLDVTMGASYSGVRALAAMKHVGLNVAADSLMAQAYTGVNGGLVIIVCDDPGIHSSQTEQDTRLYARLAGVPILEPSDAQEALEFTRLAFSLSEQFDTPVILRSTTRLSHTRAPVELHPRQEVPDRQFVDDPAKNVMLPTTARRRHPFVVQREQDLSRYFDESPLTKWETGDPGIGIITMSVAYTYVKEVLPQASILKLPCSYPLPRETIRAFCESVQRVIVVEELEPFVETEIRAMGIEVEGKAFIPRIGELSPEVVRDSLADAGVLSKRAEHPELDFETLLRPPGLCPGCPHIGSYMALRAIDARVAGDIGCYTLAANEPLGAMDTCVAMGSSIGNAAGMALAGTETKPIVATIGDSTFLHGGIPALMDAVYNKANITVMLLDNHTVAMTGGQHHPGTGRTLRGEETHKVDYEAVCRAVGVQWFRKVDSYDLGELYQIMREAADYDGVSVVVADRPCVLDPVKIKGPSFEVRAAGCVACQACMNLSCPAISWSDELYDDHHKVQIDVSRCIGCTLCVQVCPTDCIQVIEQDPS
ncbi:MAG: indolepyruvate ferredoxin oxidoreductase subunit alpha [Pseudomonadales bacterium]|jgi:indolepyruvate ferredoxin oxidoreductase alpha subunit|nr:indolepyruvate ferredoxin oxidoreductase subunit alpha [Pseudomonadales bacterium]MDP6472524.1 indolepyruvate ferredoxin oxidoreductase subunit alpha [Pseudomonadales bacterium]MDP6829005.1 indolepyruvate ferredoxin oxidoreductase subunit alpha [Pseudomonadales bacterium]MDP6969900.1 indolepyruvate ferredoxin oxidoreductase subunit alpha [Pseudomonadales bacterium]|tara:strand:+ start:138 stop:1964 length:1827 start_codon:yes stop_codon:yes gene_type:complete